MGLNDAITSFHEIKKFLDEMKLNITHFYLEFLGGEILTYPYNDLCEIVKYAREYFGKFYKFDTGCQTNLIGSQQKVENLIKLFGKDKVSTSIDSFSSLRTVNGCDLKYRAIFKKNDDYLAKNYHRLPAVYVLDSDGLDNLEREVKRANHLSRNLNIRLPFNGGKDVNYADLDRIAELMCGVFDKWVMNSNIIIDPFYLFLKKRINTFLGKSVKAITHCNFQCDCAIKSLNIDPSGDIYLCQEMADANLFKLGNVKDRRGLDQPVWNILQARTRLLHKDCLSCPYLKECQGGCMVNSIQSGNGVYGKPNECIVWKAIFRRIDSFLLSRNPEEVIEWLDNLETK
nr:SPASM domain-containing protein [Cysteiniphilum litorale]